MVAGAHPEAAGSTLQGTLRAVNQDEYEILASGHVVVLADGVAGRGDGAAASHAATQAVCEYLRMISCGASAPAVVRSSGSIAQLDVSTAEGHLRSAFALAHEAVVKAVDAGGAPAATCLLLALVLEEQVVIAHVGDCRAYRLRHAFLTQLTEDHRRCPPELARLSEQDVAAIRPLVCFVERVLGDDPKPECELTVGAIEPGDTLLFCSNGLSDALPRWLMAEILSTQTESAAACVRLLQTAARVGAEDDATVVVVRLRRAQQIREREHRTPPGFGTGGGP